MGYGIHHKFETWLALALLAAAAIAPLLVGWLMP
jgi:hypothetical protein